MLLVVVGQVIEVLGQTCIRASFLCGLWNGVSIDDRQVCVFSSKKTHGYRGVHFFTFLCVSSPSCIVRVSNLGRNVCCGVGMLCRLLVWSHRPRNDFGRAKKVENGYPVPMYRLDTFLTITLYFRTMLLVVVGQAEEVLSQTCTRASFPCGLGNGVSIDDREVCVFSSKKDTRKTPCTNVAFGPLPDHHLAL